MTPFAWDPALGADVMKTLTDKGFDKDPNGIAKSYHEIQRFVSGATDLVAVPGPNAAPELVTRFNKALGVPDTPDGYGEYKFKEGYAADPEYVKWSKTFFHKLGVPASKAQSAIDMWTEFADQRGAQLSSEAATLNSRELQELETKMGAEKWREATTRGQAAFKALGLPADVFQKIERGIGSSALMQLAAALGAKLPAEAAVLTGGGASPTDPSQMTLEQLNAAKTSLLADKEWSEAYYSPQERNPKHNEAVQRMLSINTAIAARQRAARGA